MMQAHGVIDGLAESLDDGDFAPRIDGGAENDFLEQVDGEMLRTGEGRRKTAGFTCLRAWRLRNL